MAQPVTAAAASNAAATAAVPIPISDAAALAPIQVVMRGRIPASHDLELKAMRSGTAET